ncbi:TIGR04086 family membrane protein [Dielma fastidiosa]|uniref:TIGR04086 family membrane protein n=1 Tax=Dielma fastidiosa TaxID=1034346 RepID=UPI000ED3044F|nr:TIGR04086 family membrane protein [Dielma fastidiosa]HAH95078.1 TIGR04086 family membrane protein [Dielma fastidiosa]
MKQKAITISISFGILLGSTFLLSLIFALLFHFGLFSPKSMKLTSLILGCLCYFGAGSIIGIKINRKPFLYALSAAAVLLIILLLISEKAFFPILGVILKCCCLCIGCILGMIISNR